MFSQETEPGLQPAKFIYTTGSLNLLFPLPPNTPSLGVLNQESLWIEVNFSLIVFLCNPVYIVLCV